MDRTFQDDAQALKTAIDRFTAQMRYAVPAKVTGFDPATQLATCVPAIRKLIAIDLEAEYVDIPPIIRVPVIYPHAQSQGFALTLPVAKGDDVLLIVSDRSIDQWVEFGGIQNPHEPIELRHNDLTDSLAIVGATPSPRALANYLTDGIELRNKDRSTRVTVLEESVEIRNSGGASVTLNSDGSVTIDSPSKITQCAPLLEWIADNISVSPKGGGGVEANMFDMTLRVKELITPSVSSYNNHTHGGIQPGGSSTAIPDP